CRIGLSSCASRLPASARATRTTSRSPRKRRTIGATDPFFVGRPVVLAGEATRSRGSRRQRPSRSIMICAMTMTDTDLRQRREAIFKAHVEAECRHDVAGTVDTFATPHYDVVALGAETPGAEAVTE